MVDIADIIGKCSVGESPRHKQTKDENGELTNYCPLCSQEDYCLYLNKERLLTIRNMDCPNDLEKYSYFYECLRPFVKNIQNKNGDN